MIDKSMVDPSICQVAVVGVVPLALTKGMVLQLRARFKLLWIPLQRMGCKLLNFRFISSGNFGKKIDMNGTKTSRNSPPLNALMELLIGLKLGIPLAGFMVCLNLTKRWRNCRRRLSDHNAPHGKPQQETIQFNSARLSSQFYGGRQQMSFPLNNNPILHS